MLKLMLMMNVKLIQNGNCIVAVQSIKKTNLVIGVAQDSTIWVEGRMIDIRDTRSYLERFLQETPNGVVVISADAESRSEITLLLHDQCQAAGIKEVYIGAANE